MDDQNSDSQVAKRRHVSENNDEIGSNSIRLYHIGT